MNSERLIKAKSVFYFYFFKSSMKGKLPFYAHCSASRKAPLNTVGRTSKEVQIGLHYASSQRDTKRRKPTLALCCCVLKTNTCPWPCLLHFPIEPAKGVSGETLHTWKQRPSLNVRAEGREAVRKTATGEKRNTPKGMEEVGLEERWKNPKEFFWHFSTIGFRCRDNCWHLTDMGMVAAWEPDLSSC